MRSLNGISRGVGSQIKKSSVVGVWVFSEKKKHFLVMFSSSQHVHNIIDNEMKIKKKTVTCRYSETKKAFAQSDLALAHAAA